jgi:hypothetical protein
MTQMWLAFTHGICPSCTVKIMAELDSSDSEVASG